MPAKEQLVNEERYKLIPRTLIFINNENLLLLIKGSGNKKLWPNKYNGIGGHVEQGENILDAARRELQEETGLISDDLWLCGIVTVDTGENTGIGIYVFRGESINREIKPSNEGTSEWIKDNEYLKLPLVEDLYKLLPKTMAMRKSSTPFFAHSVYDMNGNLLITFAD